MKILSSIILAIGSIIGALWGAFIALDGFFIDRAKSEVRVLEVKVDTQYRNIDKKLDRLEDKLDRLMEKRNERTQ